MRMRAAITQLSSWGLSHQAMDRRSGSIWILADERGVADGLIDSSADCLMDRNTDLKAAVSEF